MASSLISNTLKAVFAYTEKGKCLPSSMMISSPTHYLAQIVPIINLEVLSEMNPFLVTSFLFFKMISLPSLLI